MKLSYLLFGVAVGFMFTPDLKSAQAANIPGTQCPAFPADNWWHRDVSKLKVHPRSSTWMKNMRPHRMLHPDFGPSYGALSGPYGIPITVVGGEHEKVDITFEKPRESDKKKYPLGNDTKVEGWSYAKKGDRHTIVVDKSNCTLFETYLTRRSDRKWLAYSGAIWNLKTNTLRKDGWTSGDAAGLPILPGLLRYEEAKADKIDHAIRFTTDLTDKKYLWPARHHSGNKRTDAYPPMGARFRLKKTYQIKSNLTPETKAVLKAMKKYGLVLADNGTAWYFSGTADNRWSEQFIKEMKQIPASEFEAVDTLPLKISNDSMKVK